MATRDHRTADLLSWEPPQVAVGYGPDVAGRGKLENQIARLLARALRDVREDKGLTRADVAALMARELQRAVSEDQLDKWTSEASTGHRIPLDAFAALVVVTGVEDLLAFIPAMLGFAVVPRKYAEIIEMHLIEEKERELADAKARLQARLRSRA
ncbi:hypothetical protein SAMN02983003_3137 [Devosia enhydra]|uniref:Uncharacterized protein n=1 Tax=Devosia enhydra TaxID=665118 RepID=A0A1K2I0P5_9HYPH|nr:hypothetical protein [Devosia enhydra]SFZ85965.1 hypothetical protein SAMN02983003_3137 [Devosia enhydra]